MAQARTKPPFHADHVGSLLRPRPLIEARTAFLAGRLSADVLQAMEDRSIEEAIGMQEGVGLQSITDGEMRRTNWRDRFFETVDGFGGTMLRNSFTFSDHAGNTKPGIPVPNVESTLRRRTAMSAGDFAFLKAHTGRTAKATLPSPTVNHFFAGDRCLEGSPYPDRRAYLADVAAIYRQEIADLAAAGCSYLQLDEVCFAILCDPKNRAIVKARGEDPDELIGDYVTAINATVRDRPPNMTIVLHLCRGNNGAGLASGGYDPVGERLFGELEVDGYFLEYDTERAGGFEPLALVRSHAVVVLGVISTKLRALEPADMIRRRVADASRYIDGDRLCISPQCGFASGYNTDRFTHEDERRKLAHLVSIAAEIWG